MKNSLVFLFTCSRSIAVHTLLNCRIFSCVKIPHLSPNSIFFLPLQQTQILPIKLNSIFSIILTCFVFSFLFISWMNEQGRGNVNFFSWTNTNFGNRNWIFLFNQISISTYTILYAMSRVVKAKKELIYSLFCSFLIGAKT